MACPGQHRHEYSEPNADSVRNPTITSILTIKYLLIYYLYIGMLYRRLPPTGRESIIIRAHAHENLSEVTTMKKIIAIVAVIASAQASAWWGGNGWDRNYNNGYGYGNGYTNGVFDGVGDAAGSGDFSMNFSGRGRTNMRGYGSGYGAGDGWGRGYNYSAPYWGGPYGYAPYGYGPAPVAPAAPEAAE